MAQSMELVSFCVLEEEWGQGQRKAQAMELVSFCVLNEEWGQDQKMAQAMELFFFCVIILARKMVSLNVFKEVVSIMVLIYTLSKVEDSTILPSDAKSLDQNLVLLL